MRNQVLIAFIVVFSFGTSGAQFTEFSYGDFYKIVTSSRVKTISEAISKIPKEFRSNYTLMKDSESLQLSSPLSPRAILFGSTANFVLTFNGDPSMRGYNALETVSFNSVTNRVHFRTVVFRSDSNYQKWTKFNVAKAEGFNEDTEVEYFDERVLITKPNPMSRA